MTNNNIVPFSFEGTNIRTTTINNVPYFVGADVANLLGYKSTKDAIQLHCKNKTSCPFTDLSGREQEMTVIPESDVYRLIIRSKLPSAEKFEKWVMEEVLPSIRKNGTYSVPRTYEQIMQEAILLADQKVKELEQKILLDKPKVAFASAVEGSLTSVKVEDWIKSINKERQIDMGRNKAFSWLRDNGFLQKNNRPYQRYIDMCIFEVKQGLVATTRGTIHTFTTLVTGKGQLYLLEKIQTA